MASQATGRHNIFGETLATSAQGSEKDLLREG